MVEYVSEQTISVWNEYFYVSYRGAAPPLALAQPALGPTLTPSRGVVDT